MCESNEFNYFQLLHNSMFTCGSLDVCSFVGLIYVEGIHWKTNFFSYFFGKSWETILWLSWLGFIRRWQYDQPLKASLWKQPLCWPLLPYKKRNRNFKGPVRVLLEAPGVSGQVHREGSGWVCHNCTPGTTEYTGLMFQGKHDAASALLSNMKSHLGCSMRMLFYKQCRRRS